MSLLEQIQGIIEANKDQPKFLLVPKKLYKLLKRAQNMK